MEDMVNSIINEIAYGDVLAKQRSITSLFPTFHDRVKKVANNGGVRLEDVDEEEWKFRVHSSDKNIWYQDMVRFKDIEDAIKHHVSNKKLWKKDGSGVDYRLLGTEVLYDCDMELYCSCPAFLYWGSAYILTKRLAKYTEPEDRRPKIRNPREYGAMCKHLQLVFNVLPFYTNTMSKYIKAYYDSTVKSMEKEIQKRDAELKRGAEFLKRREEEQARSEEEERKPEGEEGTDNSQKEGDENA
jgi:hypothetical protein